MARRPSSSSKWVIYAALVGNLLVATTKFIAAAWTGSSGMLSEAIHSVVDTGNQVLLLYGIRRSGQPPDEQHPLGYGRELYFWSFIVALLIFTVGAGVTFIEGVSHILSPSEIVDAKVNYIVLGVSAVFEGTTWYYAWRAFQRVKGTRGYFEAMIQSKDPPEYMVLFEDTAAMIGLAFAFLGTLLSELLGMPMLDGVASIGISVLLAAVAFVLARESKGLLLGEPASRRIRDSILRIVRDMAGIERAQLIFTVHLSPDQVVAALNLEFADRLRTPAIERKVRALEKAIYRKHPEVIAILIRPRAVKRGSPPTGMVRRAV